MAFAAKSVARSGVRASRPAARTSVKVCAARAGNWLPGSTPPSHLTGSLGEFVVVRARVCVCVPGLEQSRGMRVD